MLAVVTADAGEASFQYAAVDELFEDVVDDGAEWAVLGLEGFRIYGHEGPVMAMDALPEGRLPRVAGPVRLHVGRGLAAKNPLATTTELVIGLGPSSRQPDGPRQSGTIAGSASVDGPEPPLESRLSGWAA